MRRSDQERRAVITLYKSEVCKDGVQMQAGIPHRTILQIIKKHKEHGIT
jgi:hypothetical protein